MFVSALTMSQPLPPNGNPGSVPPWLTRDMGIENVTPTEPAQRGWWLDSDWDEWQPGWHRS